MKIKSSDFQNNELMPQKFTCDGLDINPKLEISDIPENAQSLVLIVDDPDASIGTWTHWTLFNIDPKTTEISENSVPRDSIQGLTSANNTGYHGPCPHQGKHRYFFKIYALDIKLNLENNSTKAQIEEAIQNHILDKAELIGLYERPH